MAPVASVTTNTQQSHKKNTTTGHTNIRGTGLRDGLYDDGAAERSAHELAEVARELMLSDVLL